jgi:hypothetical protein
MGFVDGLKLGHRLELNDDPLFNEQVDAIAAVDTHIAIYDGQAVLAFDPKPTSDKLELQAGLVGGFEQPWTQLSMDVDRRLICSVTSFNLISALSAFSAVIRYRTCETRH